MSYPDKKFIVEVVELIKSLLNFCDYEISNSKNEITIMAKQKDIFSILMFLKDNPSISMESLIDLTAIDYPNQEKRFILAYNLLSVSKNLRIKVKTKISEDVPTQSITDIYPCANWYEREVWDLFGIAFNNHPDLRRLLTDYGFIGHPLRKDFPLSGNVEVKYDLNEKKVVYEPVKLTQSFREFDFESPWKGEKLDNNNE